MKDITGLMKQAQGIQTRISEAQNELERLEVTGEAGAGLVRVTLTAKGVLKGLDIDPSLMKPDECEMVEDLIKAAHGEAKRKADEAQHNMMADVTKGFPIPPGIDLPFGIKS